MDADQTVAPLTTDQTVDPLTTDRLTVDPLTAELRAAERRLQAAQLAADVEVLDELLDERLVFTGPDGRLYGKADDLELQRSGRQRLVRVAEEELAVLVSGGTGVTWFLGTLAGAVDGQEFTARLRYTRTWVRAAGGGWRVIAAHAGVVAGD